jgi:hypothetical protein
VLSQITFAVIVITHPSFFRPNISHMPQTTTFTEQLCLFAFPLQLGIPHAHSLSFFKRDSLRTET